MKTLWWIGRSGRALPALALILSLTASALAAPDDPARVHALLVGVSEGGLVGVDRDLDRMQDVLARGLGERASLKILQNREATREAVLEYYRGLEIAPIDTLLFYYSGPAAGERPSDHRLRLPGPAPLARDELRTEMMQLNPRLIVILTECAGPRAAPPDDAEVVADAPSEEMKARCRRLLLEHQGTVDVSSATLDPRADNQASWGDAAEGGVFTAAFDGVLRGDKPPAATATWSHVDPLPDDVLVLLADRVETDYRILKDALLKEPSRLDGDDLDRLEARKPQRPEVLVRQVREVERSAPPRAGRGDRLGGLVVEAAPRYGGVRVTSLARGSAAETRGFEVGDVIVSIDGAATETPVEFQAAMDRVIPGGTARLTVRDPKDRAILEYVDLCPGP